MKMRSSAKLFRNVHLVNLTPSNQVVKRRNLHAIKDYQKTERDDLCKELVETVKLAGVTEFDSQQYHGYYMNITA